MKTKNLVKISLYSALFVVLEFISNMVPLFRMPQGGSLSLGPIALLVASYDLGWRPAVLVSVLSILISSFVPGNTLYIYNPMQFALDYIVAYGVYGFASCFKDFNRLPVGVLMSGFARFMAHNCAGWMFFGSGFENIFWGVVGYNASYMIPTTLLSFAIIMIVKPRLKS